MLSSLLPNVNTERQDNHDSMALQPIGNVPSSSERERTPTNTQRRFLSHSTTRPTLVSATTDFLNSCLFMQRPSKSTKSGSVFLCVFMHVFLVLLHLVLVALSISGVEHHLVTSENGARNPVLSASTQAFYALYCTILVYLVQRRTLYQNLIQHQKLTILHDNVNAWSGLGSALQCLWQQPSTTGSLWWIVSITTYLGCVFALHVASSSILQLQTFSATTNVSATTFSHWPGLNVDMMGLQWHTISAIVPSLGHFASSSNAGLDGATLYDIVQADGATGNATVDATNFRAECGLLRNSELSYSPQLNANQFGDYVIEPQVSGLNQTMKWSARLVPPYQDQLKVQSSMSLLFPGPTIVFITATSVDIDDTLKSATVQHMNWEHQQVPLFDSPQAPIISTALDAHLVACNIYVERHAAIVNIETGQLLALFPPPALSPPSSWKAWTAPKGDKSWDIWSPPGTGQYDHNHKKWFVSPFSYGATHPVKICMTESQATCYGYSLLELYLMKEIGLNVVLDEQGSRPPPPSGPKKVLCSPRQFESSLAKIFASLLWTDLKDRHDAGAKLGSNAGGFDPTPGSTVVSQQVTKWHLNINTWPLAVALTASLTMLVLSICMLGGTRRQKNRTPIDSAGILQIIWLTNRLRVLKDLVSEVADPSEDALRSAGMLEVDLLQELNRHE
ncbi:hypothetical protein DEU56DRAFT_925103 [Suillus clintonianus]|uniref:uncharacterized protein n=1 Tax=Suillus clintonianus TaxID=1904413 RepID=UPI001B8678B3|nr:uncharacterized protein DEU56DRAFT_925103 [Suillus clintonianus]KAG2123225.1 hypothetical protein DEU56DRAFT_925103 [Suillus clintonianus]